MKVILYCRVSTDEQVDGCSLDMQRRHLNFFCETQQYEIEGIYYEDYSAQYYDMRRPEMKKIYNYCKNHKNEIGKILFLRWDRYSRNVEFAFAYKRKFYDELGIEINAVESPIDFKSPDWPTLLAIYCGTAQTENEKISRRVKDGIHGTLLKGKWPGKAPLGYKNVRTDKHNTHVEIDSPTAGIIRKVFLEVAKGIETPSRIRQRLCPGISQSSFFRMLRNVFYMGKIHVPAYHNDPEMFVTGMHEAIVTEETFDKVQEVLDGKKKKRSKLGNTANPEFFLRKFLVCPICGHALTGAFSRGNGGRYPYGS